MKKLLSLMLAFCLVLSLVACNSSTVPDNGGVTTDPSSPAQDSNTTSSVDPSEMEPFRVAMITPLSGSKTFTGNEYLAGFQSAFEMLDLEINGRKIEVVSADGYDMDTQMAEFERLAADGITVFAGGSSQVVDFSLASMVDSMEILYISNNWDHTIVQGESKFFNQPLETTDNFGMDLANKCAEIAMDFLGKNDASEVKIAFVHSNEIEYLVEPFLTQAEELGMQIVIDEAYPVEQKDFTSILTKIQNTEFDILVPLQKEEDGSLFLTKMHEMGINPVILAGGSYYDTPAFANLGNEITNGIMTLSYPTPGMLKSTMPSMQEFYDYYMEKMGHEPLTHALLGYGSGTMIATVLADTDPSEWENTALLAEKIRALDYDYGEFPGWYWGIKLDETGKNSRAMVSAVNQWVDGSLVCIYPSNMAVGEPNIPWTE